MLILLIKQIITCCFPALVQLCKNWLFNEIYSIKNVLLLWELCSMCGEGHVFDLWWVLFLLFVAFPFPTWDSNHEIAKLLIKIKTSILNALLQTIVHPKRLGLRLHNSSNPYLAKIHLNMNLHKRKSKVVAQKFVTLQNVNLRCIIFLDANWQHKVSDIKSQFHFSWSFGSYGST